jgi:pyruvate-ferredoxin/flavodoxin oxidoreductase
MRLSIFGDHSDVMSARSTGFAMLSSASVQEAMDLALIAQAATLESRIPFLHFFDGFRTSHEVAKIELLTDDEMRSMIDDDLVVAHRLRAMNPDRPVLRGHGAESRRLFPGARGGQQVLPEVRGRGAAGDGQVRGVTGRGYHF